MEEPSPTLPASSSKRNIEMLEQVQPMDLIKYGLIPEFIGRLPVVATLNALDEEALVKILTEPKNALTRQYAKFFEYDGVDLEFTDGALKQIAKEIVVCALLK